MKIPCSLCRLMTRITVIKRRKNEFLCQSCDMWVKVNEKEAIKTGKFKAPVITLDEKYGKLIVLIIPECSLQQAPMRVQTSKVIIGPTHTYVLLRDGGMTIYPAHCIMYTYRPTYLMKNGS